MGNEFSIEVPAAEGTASAAPTGVDYPSEVELNPPGSAISVDNRGKTVQSAVSMRDTLVSSPRSR